MTEFNDRIDYKFNFLVLFISYFFSSMLFTGIVQGGTVEPPATLGFGPENLVQK